MKLEDIKTKIVVKYKNGNYRIIHTEGNWSYLMALSLAKDISMPDTVNYVTVTRI